jgi:hypothetical protein
MNFEYHLAVFSQLIIVQQNVPMFIGTIIEKWQSLKGFALSVVNLSKFISVMLIEENIVLMNAKTKQRHILFR